jgi:ABC-type multidrug transport system ATPase subunit/pSer/pThr/pTyr-binding forkhead associated (FHA) protein
MTGLLRLQPLPAGIEQVFDGSRPVVVGRDEGADVIVLDPRSSRRHIVFRIDAGLWVLEDKSSRGTYVGGVRVSRLELHGPLVVMLGDPTNGPGLGVSVVDAPVVPNAPVVPVAPVVQVAPSVPAGPPADPPVATTAPPSTPLGPEAWAGAEPARGPDPTIGLVAPPIGSGRPPAVGELSSFYDTAPRVRIGRADDNDIVVPDLLASRHHAEMRAIGGGRFEIVDLSSHNGVFVDGVRIGRKAPLPEGATVSVGHHLFRLWQGRLEEYVDAGNVSFAARDLVVRAGPRRLVDGVSFALDAGEFLAVLGPTGAGKSTLLKALIGSHPADEGHVLYNGRDVYAAYAELRNRIGYVPQDDLIHSQLSVRSALLYAARLRFPPDVPEADREARVEEVMAELGLTERAELAVSHLSGGQRKRTSMAIELLTRPSLLVLDEPTSGLDPGYEKSVMDLLRHLADGARTVITVTHSVQSLDRCDRLLFLAPGGETAFFGPPDESLGFFKLPDYPDVFQALDRARPGFAKAAFAGSVPDQRYVRAPLALGQGQSELAAAVAAVAGQAHWGHQFVTLLRRYVAVIVADPRNTVLLLLQAPVLGLLMLVVLGHDNLNLASPSARDTANTVLVALVLAATYLGASNSIREIVKERAILTRERAIGISASAYVLSKAVVLGALTTVQAVILVAFGTARQDGPGHGSFLSSGRLELFVVVILTGLAAMGLGLLMSALVSNADKALTILPVILLTQFLLTGAVFNISHTPGIDQLGYLNSSRWGYSAAASTTDLDAIQRDGCNAAAVLGRPQLDCNAIQRHSGGIWLLDIGALIALTGLTIAGAERAIRPLGQPRRRQPSRWRQRLRPGSGLG